MFKDNNCKRKGWKKLDHFQADYEALHREIIILKRKIKISSKYLQNDADSVNFMYCFDFADKEKAS